MADSQPPVVAISQSCDLPGKRCGFSAYCSSLVANTKQTSLNLQEANHDSGQVRTDYPALSLATTHEGGHGLQVCSWPMTS